MKHWRKMIRKKSRSYTQTRCPDFLDTWDCQSFTHLELFIVPMHFASLSGIGFATFIKILNKFNNVQPFTELKTDIR